MSHVSCVRFVVLLVLSLLCAASSYAGVQFQPVSQEELKMTSEPNAPGAPAIILYRELYRDDCGITCHSTSVGLMSVDRFENNYFRIKILTEAGRKYGDIEIPLSEGVGNIANINARTIRPDGSIVNFSGQIFQKTIVKTKGFKYIAKTFTMPDVQVGSIIEYYYTVNFQKGPFIYFSNWVLNQELFTKKAKFSLRYFQSNYYPISFRWSEHLSPGSPSPKQKGDAVELEVANIGAFQAEDFMPPENELKERVDFIYSAGSFEPDTNQFWKTVGKSSYGSVEKFVGRRGPMEQAVSQIVTPSDPPEVKLKKIYARVQQLHNTSYEVQKTEQEQKRENPNPTQSVEDVWKRGSGDSSELSWLFLALVRAAGFEAYPVLVADRRNFFFDPKSEQSDRLDADVVLVKLNGKDVYFDPGAAFTPFGMLHWEATGVPGLRLDKDGGSWVQTSLPESSASQIQRKGVLKLLPTGDLEGTLMVTFTGLEGQRWRVDERNEDVTARKKALEDEVKGYIPIGSEVELTKQPDWTSSDSPLVAEFSLKVPGWVTLSGRRAMFPVGLFSATEKHVFEFSQRAHPIYFEFLSQKLDDITLEVPTGWQISAVPKPQNQDLRVVGYAVSAENNQGALHLTRKVDISIVSLDTKYYGPLRSFYQIVKAGDEQQIVLVPSSTVSAN